MDFLTGVIKVLGKWIPDYLKEVAQFLGSPGIGSSRKRGCLTYISKAFTCLPIIIPIEEKPWNLNLLAPFCKNYFLLVLTVCPSWLVGETYPYVATVLSLIQYGVDTAISYRTTHFPFNFFYSIRSSLLLNHQGL